MADKKQKPKPVAITRTRFTFTIRAAIAQLIADIPFVVQKSTVVQTVIDLYDASKAEGLDVADYEDDIEVLRKTKGDYKDG